MQNLRARRAPSVAHSITDQPVPGSIRRRRPPALRIVWFEDRPAEGRALLQIACESRADFELVKAAFKAHLPLELRRYCERSQRWIIATHDGYLAALLEHLQTNLGVTLISRDAEVS